LRRFIAFGFLLFLMTPVAAQTGVGLTCYDCPCPVSTTGGGGVLLITPEGNGDNLEATGMEIRLSIIDCNGDPVAGFPFNDLWLQPSSPNVSFVTRFFAAANTNVDGETYWSGRIAGGGWMDTSGADRTRISLAGVEILPDLDLSFVSPDLNGDLKVDIVDVATFALDWNTGWTFRSDLTADGVINLADVGVLAAYLGEDGNN